MLCYDLMKLSSCVRPPRWIMSKAFKQLIICDWD